MPDQTITNENSPDNVQVGAPPVVAPPATPAPAAAPVTPPARPQAAKAKPAGGGKGQQNMIKIPAPAFKERVRRDANALVQQATGLPMDKVIELVKNAGIRSEGGGKSAAQNTADAALKASRMEIEKLTKERDRLKREGEDREKKHKKELRRAQDRAIEAELASVARSAGITQPRYIQFAIADFAREVSKNPNLKPEDFFAGLKATDPGFFQGAAPPPPPPAVPATTAPAESTSQGEQRPVAKPAGTPPDAPNVDAMSDSDFAAHRRQTYGFPG